MSAINHSKIIAKLARPLFIFIAVSFLLICAFSTNSFAKDTLGRPFSPSKASDLETDKTEDEGEYETPESDTEENQVQDAPEGQTVKAENYKQYWDDAMIAAPAFGD